MPEAYEGKLITFEGGEGSGKSTLIEGIKPIIEASGKEIIWTREPGGTNIGEKIRNILLDTESKEMTPKTEALLMQASRNQLVNEIIIPFISKGGIVFSDRFYDSSLSYQGFGRNLGFETIYNLSIYATEGINPDLTILTKLPYEIAQERLKNRAKLDRLDAENREFHERVNKGFEYLAKKFPERIKIIDATKSAEEMQKDTIKIFKEMKII